MPKHNLTIEERCYLQIALGEGHSQRSIAKGLGRHVSTVSREIRRNCNEQNQYVATAAHQQARERHQACRPSRKLLPGCGLFEIIASLLREFYSPEQIAGTIKSMGEPDQKYYVCHETIYNALYALPAGELRKELMICLRQGRSTRKPRRGTVDRRGQIPDMVNIALRPPEVDERILPGHWEGDLIKGKGNASAIGTLVERVSGYVILARMADATATSAVAGFSAALNRMPQALRKSLTYDQGRELSRHMEITQKTGVAIYFCDPHSPWQRGSNENTNGLLRQYFPKGTELSGYTQEELDAVALQLNQRPRKRHGWRCPIEVIGDVFKAEESIKSVN